MSQLQNFVRLEAMNLAVGESLRTMCPVCRATHEDSFSISRLDNGVHYRCYRASCGAGSGFIGARCYSTPKNATKRKTKTFKGDLVDLPGNLLAYLKHKYDIDPEDARSAGWKYVPSQNRLFMPTKNLSGYVTGEVTKALNRTDGSPKAIVYWHGYKHMYSAHMHDTRRTCVLVEDIISAQKLSKVVNAVALLGTEMSDDTASELAKAFDHVVVMLDPDAAHKALKLRREYGLLFKRMNVVMLADDPKDIDLDIIKRYIQDD